MRSLIVCLSTLALTAAAAPKSGPGDIGERRWSLGAGVHFRGGSIAALESSELAVPTLAMERWFGRQFSLDVGIEGRASVFVPLKGEVRLQSSSGIALGLAARLVLTAPDAPVALSVFARVALSAGTVTERVPTTAFTRERNVYSVAATGGVGVERWFLPRASLRLLVGLIRSEATQTWGGPPTLAGSALTPPVGLRGRLDLLPSLELRWFF
jgi:hypothetical protein